MSRAHFDWIQEYEELNKKMSTAQEKEIPNYISVFFYYIKDNNVEKIKKRTYYTQEEKSITVNEIIELNNKYRGSYSLDEILFFEIDTGDEKIIRGEEDAKLKVIPLVLENIELKPSLFIYHDIQSIFFVYKKKNNTANTKRQRFIIKHTRKRRFTD